MTERWNRFLMKYGELFWLIVLSALTLFTYIAPASVTALVVNLMALIALSLYITNVYGDWLVGLFKQKEVTHGIAEEPEQSGENRSSVEDA